jgi:aryl carrier-like protein
MTGPTDLVSRVFLTHLPHARTMGENTNFFEAGFTSVRLTAVLADLADLDVGLGLVDLFRYPTLRDLKAELRRRGVRYADATSGSPRAHRLPWED